MPSDRVGSEPELTNLVELCGLARWRRALFSTYTLSLSFFEAYILPALNRVGCADIMILVDHSQYLESIAERQSRSAGRDYRLVPIRMKTGGVFHPKLTYLWGEREDVCSIGSGNITYPGQGSNLECLDILSSRVSPSAFLDVSDFFAALLESPALAICGERARLASYRDRSHAIGNEFPAGDRPYVLHSIRSSIALQLAQHLSSFGQVERLVCMAPFHHPAVAPILDLAKSVGAARIDLALNPSDLSAPFDPSVVARRGVETRFVVPSRRDTRPLHAKWYEFHGESNHHVFTGSVNATTAALDSTDNVEVGILRRVSPSECIHWSQRKPKNIRARAFSPLASPFGGVVSATLTAQELLSGQLYGVDAPEGTWVGRFFTRDGEHELGRIAVDSDGAFSMEAPPELRQIPNMEGAVHIRFTRGRTTVAGWLACEHDLEAPPDLRGARRALDRLSRGQALRGDILNLVHWVCSHIEEQVTQAGSGEATDHPDNRGGVRAAFDDRRRISHEAWADSYSTVRKSRGDVSAILRRAFSVLSDGPEALKRRALDHRHGGLSLGDDALEHDLEGEPAPTEEYDSILDIVEVIDRVLERLPTTPMAVELLRARAKLMIRPMLERDSGLTLAERTSAAGRAREWIAFVRRLALKGEYRQELVGLAWGLAGFAQALTLTESGAAQKASLKQLMEQIEEGLPEIDRKSAARVALCEVISLDALPSLLNPSLEAVDVIAGARTIREEFTRFLDDLAAGRRPDPTPALEQAIPAPALGKLRRGMRPTKVNDPALDGCPSCYCAVSTAEQSELRNRRAIVCRFCGRVLVWLGA